MSKGHFLSYTEHRQLFTGHKIRWMLKRVLFSQTSVSAAGLYRFLSTPLTDVVILVTGNRLNIEKIELDLTYENK